MISPDTITQVRERTDIVAVIAESVPTLKRRGRTFSGLCPFHQEKSPSFHVNPDRGFFHCFGCKESGSVIDFLMKHDGYTFPEATRALAERLGIEIVEDRSQAPKDGDRLRQQREELFAANSLAASFYEAQLREHASNGFALDELGKRGLVPGWAGGVKDLAAGDQTLIDDTLQAFRIGYAPPGWDGLAVHLKRNGISPAVAEACGLLVPRSSGSGYYDRFRHRLMFAVVDHQGRVLAFSGRALAEHPEAPHRADEKPAKYINSPESPVYSKGQALFGIYQARNVIRQRQVAVLVEGNFDVVSLHARGMANVVAPLGTAFTADQATLLKRFASHAVFLFDADTAGRKAVGAAREACRKAGLVSKVASLPEGKDPDELVRVKGIDAVKSTIAHARGMLEYLMEVALDETFAAADVHERAARVDQVAHLIGEEDDPLVRSMAKTYADQLAGRLDFQRSPEAFRALESSVKTALAKAGPRHQPIDRQKVDPRYARIASQPQGRAHRAAMVGAIIEQPSLLSDPIIEAGLELLEGLSAQTVLAVAKASQSSGDGQKNLDTTVFLAQIPPAIQDFAARRLAAPTHATLEDAREDFMKNAALLRASVLTQETTETASIQRRVEGDWDEALRLAKDARERHRTRHGLGAQQQDPPREVTLSDPKIPDFRDS